ncbi:MAG: hypothetical protein ACNS60_11345 [Candidatus Cyclobacteriaceae bacterium M2_1C_046]
MKKMLLSLILSTVLMACSDDDFNSSQIIGRWYLVEQLVDPGNGSGEYQNVNSEKFIEFYSDSTYLSNGSLCTMNINAEQETIGTYSHFTKVIKATGCEPESVIEISYNIENSRLILNYSCIEACNQRYIKVVD